MASYLEIKQTLAEILGLETEMDEKCDIILDMDSHGEESSPLIFPNDILRESYDFLQCLMKDKLQLCTPQSREVALQFGGPLSRNSQDIEPIIDTVNNITYSIGPATLEYCLFLLDEIAEKAKTLGSRSYKDVRVRSRIAIRRVLNGQSTENALSLLPEILRAHTIKVESVELYPLKSLKEYASSFEFLIMYKRSIPISEYADIEDMYPTDSIGTHFLREEVDSPPQRIYNSAVLDYYTMAMEARDPFTRYISFYHIVEHYFDAVFRKKLTDEIKNKITHPNFSYQSEEKLYDLAKYIRKHMSSDDESGRGNEFESLKYVLAEYIPIEDLKARISSLDSRAVNYYQNRFVPFTSSQKTKIAWNNPEGVYTNLATRIYETRNALVHSKSEQAANQYKPYENRKELSAEIPLMRAVAEMVLINSSEIL